MAHRSRQGNRMAQRRESKRMRGVRALRPPTRRGYGKILNFDWDLFVTDSRQSPLRKEDLEFDQDYLILKGPYSGKVVRFSGEGTVGRFAAFRSTRGNEVRIRCDEEGFACVPKLGCWMDYLDGIDRTKPRPPIVLIQSKSIIGAPQQDRLEISIREGGELVSSFTFTKITPEILELQRLEEILIKLGNNKYAHPTIKMLLSRGFFVCYEDDGWLLKSSPGARIRFMRRSHLISCTVCRCGRDVVDAMMDDIQLRSLLPCRMFTGYVGKKMQPRPGHLRRTSTMTSLVSIDLNDLLDDYDKSDCYARIFRREGATIGKLLVQDTPFLDAVRSYIEYGGLGRDCLVPSIAKWRRMVKYAAGGDEPYLQMEDVRIVNGQWADLLDSLPNSKFRRYSFSTVYYDGTAKVTSPKIAHKVVKPIRPKLDIQRVFEAQLLMNGGYLIVALSRKDIPNEKLAGLFDNIEDFVYRKASMYGYSATRLALGIHHDLMIYLDFKVFRTSRVDDDNGSDSEDSMF